MITMLHKLAFLLMIIPISVCSQNIDIQILREINTSRSLPSDPYFQFISDTHVAVCMAVPLITGIASLIDSDEDMFVKALEIGTASAINLGTSHLLKISIDRPRPFDTYPDIFEKSRTVFSSFPSGHTSAAFATATSLSLNFSKWYIVVPSYLWAGTVGYSRMYLGVHYPSDVLAGAFLGAGSAWLTYKVNHWIQSKYKKNYGLKF